MRYIIELSSANVQAIKLLIDLGKYENVQSFVQAAIENQLYIEKQPIDRVDLVTKEKEPQQQITSLHGSLVSRPISELGMKAVEVPEADLPSAQILWALYNRIFPVKVSLRVLLNILKSNPTEDGYVSLTQVQDSATEEARRLGRELSYVDKRSHRVKGDKLSTGLPRRGDKSGDRFKFHFVGSINSKNRVSGAPAILRFVAIRKDRQGQAQIGITKSGLQFASLENPVLDKADYATPISEEEANFYLQHISENLPREYALNISVLKAIESGRTTPNELIQIILDLHPHTRNEEAQAIRSSLISRLSELGLLSRRRNGLNVTYSLSMKAIDFLANQREQKETGS
jgi:hypothetical protein